jgi:hypothetical protein
VSVCSYEGVKSMTVYGGGRLMIVYPGGRLVTVYPGGRRRCAPSSASMLAAGAAS